MTTEIRPLRDGDLLASEAVGRTKPLFANERNPYFESLAQLALKAFGPPLVNGEELHAASSVTSGV